MKILLLGEFSGLHWNLAEGLRALGHDVCVASDGCGWRNYPRDIALDRPTDSLRDGICCLLRILRHWPGFRGYDVVQIISPYFLRLRSERTFACLPLFAAAQWQGLFGSFRDRLLLYSCLYGNKHFSLFGF